MEINIYNNYQAEIHFDFEKIVKDVSNYFNENTEISLILVNNEEIRNLNRDYRNIDRETDVLSFVDEDGEYLGDIFINIERVYSQAKEYNHSVEREFAFLLVHGILHLKGYDHHTNEEEIEMFAKQEEILNELNYRRENNEV
ncbi:MAG TPA: rRNA maturation RNase YbeY [Acholeplasmataceae bacterium]|jgi:probable rRNA maturation factor|nr:rRNA maturation RNase YbeY [Acholeplasmataceae bacterium]